jgi:two-component system response regulator HydG
VFAEHAPPGLTLHTGHYTIDFDPESRYTVSEWGLRSAFAGEAILVGNLCTDSRFSESAPLSRRAVEAGVRSLLAVPLRTGGRVVGLMVATALAPDRYTARHLELARQAADLISPFIENMYLLHREKRRRSRLVALDQLQGALSESLDLRAIFEPVARAAARILNFDVMGVALLASGNGEYARFAEAPSNRASGTPWRLSPDEFSFHTELAAGRTVLLHDTTSSLDPARSGDRLFMQAGARACLIVPLCCGRTAGGFLYFQKSRPRWFDPSDIEVAVGIAGHLTLALQYHRLAEEQRRAATAEGRARQLEQRLKSLHAELQAQFGFERIIGHAAPLREALARAGKVASTETTVLLLGESGTGKELVARAIHQTSPRADGPFVALNCAALPETLLESELFGHERGAFTGADRQKPGRFEIARGGTLFLDEVGELSPGVQAKLLRVLQEREFQRVGGTTTLHADVRVVAATNRDLAQAVTAGRFRQDLYYRLNVFAVTLPPLRERGDDVLLLAEHFARHLGARLGKRNTVFTPESRKRLLAYAWPGNIRELQNAVERALILAEGETLTLDDLALPPLTVATSPPVASPNRPQPIGPVEEGSIPELERTLIVRALRETGGNKSRAARILGISRSQLYTRLVRFGLEG